MLGTYSTCYVSVCVPWDPGVGGGEWVFSGGDTASRRGEMGHIILDTDWLE